MFDWSLAKVALDPPIILVDGLNSDTITNVIKQINLYAVDISSGVESAKGVKDINKIKRFLLHC